jgi:hypothetical protein
MFKREGMQIPDLSLAIMMAPGKTPSLTACSNLSSKEGVMIVVPFDVYKRCSGKPIGCFDIRQT